MQKKKLFLMINLLLLFSLMPFIGAAQYEKMLETMDDEMTMMEDGKLVLRFINAENGEPVPDAEIEIKDIGSFTSDMVGKVLIDLPEDGTYALSFSKEGFIPAVYTFEIVAGTLFSNRFSVSPEIEIGAIRIVLEWGRHPKDLDGHFIKEGDYHISFHDMHDAGDGSAKLDRDDRKGYGPETITVKDIDEKATYTYYVKNYSDRNSPRSKALSKSNATVRIYGDNQLMGTYTVPEKKKGTTWMVFNIVGGKIQNIDEIGNQY